MLDFVRQLVGLCGEARRDEPGREGTLSLRIFERHRIFLLGCSAANNGQQGKSPGSGAGARLGFDGSNNNSRALSPRRYRSSRQAMLVLCFGRSHKLHAAIPFAVVGAREQGVK